MADTVGHGCFPIPKNTQFLKAPLQKLVSRAMIEVIRRRRLCEFSHGRLAAAGNGFASEAKGLSGVVPEVCPRPWVLLMMRADA